MYDLERYLNVRSATGASFGTDGTVFFRMDTTGTFQIWSLDEPAGWPEQRTFFEEPVSFVSASPERTEAIFGMDEGGNERMQLYRLDDDGRITDLTATPEAKHRWGGWSHDGDRFAFTSNRRDEAVFDVYVQDRDSTGAEARLIHEGDGWLSVGGWSPDDSRLVLVESHSNFDQDVSVLDVESGTRRDLTSHTEEVRYQSVQWAPDGEGLYLCSDEGRDTLAPARMDLDGSIEIVTDGREGGDDEGDDGNGTVWNVDGVSVDDETGRFAYSRNVDGYTEITVGEFTGPTDYETSPSPALPGDLAGGVSWGPDGERYALSAAGRTLNTNVFVVETESGEPQRWTFASTAGIPPERFVAPELVRYQSFDGREIPAFFSLPSADVRKESGVPVIVDVHGGPESQRRPSFAGLTQYFLSRGYAVFEPNVRGSSGYGREYLALDDVEKRMDSVRDLEAGRQWLADRPAVDTDRIAVMGGSYGGFMVLAALTEFPDRWAAGVDVVGIANFVTFLENTGSWRRALREAEYGSLADDREFLESISPINNVEAIEAPLFVVHGANDPRVPVAEAEQIVERAREQGVPVEKLIFEDEGHGISKLENRIEAYTRVVEFLDEHV